MYFVTQPSVHPSVALKPPDRKEHGSYMTCYQKAVKMSQPRIKAWVSRPLFRFGGYFEGAAHRHAAPEWRTNGKAVGNPYDNAMAENFFSILKAECIHRHKPATFSEANAIFTFTIMSASG